MQDKKLSMYESVLFSLRAGARLIVVEKADEGLAVATCVKAAQALKGGKVFVVSPNDPEFADKYAAHKESRKLDVMIVCDYLELSTGNRGIYRGLREFALPQVDPPHPRLILIEMPGIEIPRTLKNDAVLIRGALPPAEEIDREELTIFFQEQGIDAKSYTDEQRREISDAVAGLERNEAYASFATCYVVNKGKLDAEWLRKYKSVRVSEKYVSAIQFMDPSGPDVGGAPFMMKWLKTRVPGFNSLKAALRKLPQLKGMLVTGIPGTGKSAFVRHVARILKLPLIRLDVGKLFGSLVGQTESQVRQAIEAIEACSPCVLWIDEIEKALSGMNGGGGDSGVSKRMGGSLLTWLQEKTSSVFVVATANRVFELPPELLRKGRFDEIFFVDLPTAEEREEIVRIHLELRGYDVKAIDPKAIAAATEGFSGAEIEQAVIDGGRIAFADSDRDVKTEDIVEAAKDTFPLSKTMAEDIAKLKAWAKGRAKAANGKPIVAPDLPKSGDGPSIPKRGGTVDWK